MKQSTRRYRARRPLALIALCGLIAAGNGTTMAQTPVSLVASHSEAARAGKLGQEAYQAGKYDVFLSEMRRAFAVRPDHPRIIYNLASALALNGKPDEALTLLERLGAMGLSMPAEKDDDFRSLAGQDRFRVACARLASNGTAYGSSVPSVTIPGKQLILEGLAYDPSSRSVFASSVRERKILRVDSAGTSSLFADRSVGLWSVFGMAVDSKRRVLWAATGAVPQTDGFTAADAGKSAIVGFDLSTGKVVQRLEPADGKQHSLGDVTLAPNGDLFASDSNGGALFVARAGSKSLDVLVPEGELLSPQGLAVTPDGSRLLVGDYALGLCVVDLHSKKVSRVAAPDSVCLLGIDGLSMSGRDLIVIQNGIRPHRVVRVRMTEGFKAVERLDVLEVGNPVFDEPTLGVVIDGWLHYIANSQWSKINAKGEMEPAEKFKDTIVLKLKL